VTWVTAVFESIGDFGTFHAESPGIGFETGEQKIMGPFEMTEMNTIVTGGAMGIGFGIASRFVEGGANVLLVDLEAGALRAAASRLSKGPGRVEVLAVDIGEEASPRVVMDRCVDLCRGKRDSKW
jgi:hypothetical protein